MQYHAHILFLLTCLPATSLLAQQLHADTTLLLKEVIIETPRVSTFSPGLKTIHFDSLTLANYKQKNVADLLADESPMFVKSYGVGSLATTSFRGGSAYHTAVLWNGINISSPLNGLMDLSLMPVITGNQIKIQKGGSSALFGSGAVAGVVHIQNNSKFNGGVSAAINLSAGSFSDYRQNVMVALSGKRLVSTLKVFNTTAKNNFKYKPNFPYDKTSARQSNGALQNQGILTENKWIINRFQSLSINAWLQHTHRKIPPTMLERISKTNQTDNALRINAEWKAEKNKAVSFIRMAYLAEKMVFANNLAVYTDVSKSNQLIAEAETKYNISNTHFINVGIHNTYATASNPNIKNKPNQNRVALFAAYLYASSNQKLNVSVSARQELVNQNTTPFTYTAGGNYNVKKWLAVQANFSKVYRIPTFNDLYWTPGGNQNLKAEHGYASEASINFNFKYKNVLLKTDITLFNRNIENWILWLPDVWYWSPHNIMHVWSRGVETNSTLTINTKNPKVSIALLTNYVPSSNRTSKTENDNSVNKQLIYTPMYSGMAKLTVAFHKWVFIYRHNYIGYRYTSTDNTQYLPPYDLGSAHLSYNLKVKSMDADVFIEANNIWKKQYQVLLHRPMPGINFQAGLAIQFNNPKNK